MAYDEGVAQRLREALEPVPNVVERKMFGGIAFMVDGHMTCGINDESLMARIGPQNYTEALEKAHVRQMDFTGRPLRGYVYVDPPGFETDEDLAAWVRTCLDFVSTLPPK